MEERNGISIVSKEPSQAIGLRWEGTFEEAARGDIRNVHAELQRRLPEIKQAVNPHDLLALSYHIQAGGFTHYAVVEVRDVQDIPEGMHAITVPALTCAKYEHRQEQSVDESYSSLYAWIEKEGHRPSEGELTHYEICPVAHDPHAGVPAFTILIPIETTN